MSEQRSKGTDPPLCKICNNRHWGVAHVWGKAPAAPVATVVTSPKGVSAVVHGEKKPSKKSLAALGELVDAAVERIKAKPTKRKRKSPMVAKDGTNRGRPANVAKGKPPFDKKAHDRAKAAERRAAAKAEPGKAKFAGSDK
jgi:hypothetical protein